MSLLHAIALGLLQGLAEFLPISSSAHLWALPWLVEFPDPGLAFDVALHLGTLLSLLLYFRADLLRLGRAFLRVLTERRIGDDTDRRLACWVIAGSLPGGVIGFFGEHAAERLFRAPLPIAVAMATMGLLLYWADTRMAGARPIGGLTFRDTLWIGFAQACAIMPGVSRSGSTITAGRLLGLSRDAAARFSFLLALPIVAGAGLVKVPKLAYAGGLDAMLLIGMAVSALAGYAAIHFLLGLIRRWSFLPFAIYRVGFGLAIVGVYAWRR